jgi:hypothetical protein
MLLVNSFFKGVIRFTLPVFSFLFIGNAGGKTISAAERLLFLDDHLHSVATSGTLHYEYTQKIGDDVEFVDEVRVRITRLHPGKPASVAAAFLSGHRKISLPLLSQASGNPALMGFLERDLLEMQRLTGGASAYFRKRIRLALADANHIHPVSINHLGKRYKGSQVTIQPYINDPLRARFPAYVNKTYTFSFSSHIPGSLYRVHTSTGTSEAGSTVEETMTFVGKS